MRLTPNYRTESDYVQIIEEVKNFKYLGNIISSNEKTVDHFNKGKKLFFSGKAEIKNRI